MNSNNLLKYINEYFNTFNNKDYTIYVDGISADKCYLNDCGSCVIWSIPTNSDESDWYRVYACEIHEVSMTATTMVIKKTNGKEYTFVAKVKTKEQRAKEIILKAKTALHVHLINDAMDYLDELNALMNE